MSAFHDNGGPKIRALGRQTLDTREQFAVGVVFCSERNAQVQDSGDIKFNS